MPQFDKAALDINSKVNQFQKTNVSAINQSLQDIKDLIYKNEQLFNSDGSCCFYNRNHYCHLIE